MPELLAAAAAVKPDSPAYVTVNYHRVRLLPENEARDLTDKLLGGELPVSARNQFRAERMRMAAQLRGFPALRARALRWTADAKDVDVLDGDSALILDRAVPLALLRQASTSALLPDATRKELQSVVSVRALVLDPAPNFDAVFRLLNTPGGAPFVRSGYGRYTDEANKIDNFRDNWWCAGSPVQPDWAPARKKGADPVARFLTPEEQKQAVSEREKLDGATGCARLAQRANAGFRASSSGRSANSGGVVPGGSRLPLWMFGRQDGRLLEARFRSAASTVSE